MLTRIKHLLKNNLFETILFFLFFIFANFLMWETFRLSRSGNIEIASKAWSDFAATIPLIRSFSYGSNFPPQYPIFAGPPIRYHFIFFMMVGSLEKIGVPLDWALNSLSALGFFLLLLGIYYVGKIVFKSRAVGVTSVILFLFNGSFAFLEFFKKHPLSPSTPADIITNTTFSSFGPYDGSTVSAFWNLNIYTNQRHLALAYGFFLVLVLLIYKFSKNPGKLTWKKTFLMGFILGLFPFLHFSVFIMCGLSLITFLMIYKKIRLKLFSVGLIAFILAIPQYLYMGSPEIKVNIFNPGYLVESLSLVNFVEYWFLNLGITTVLSLIGFFLAKKGQRKIILPFLSFFIIGNLFQFTPDMPTNHKFFNLFLIGINFFTAFLIYKIFSKNVLGKIFVFLIFPFLILSGVIDLFPIFNDRIMTIQDIPNNKTAKFIVENTPKDSVFLNSSYLYNPTSLAGRKIFMGWPYFAWGAGYDTNTRSQIVKKALSSSELSLFCDFSRKYNVDFIEIQNPTTLEDVKVNYPFFDNNFEKIYHDPYNNISIYKISNTCD